MTYRTETQRRLPSSHSRSVSTVSSAQKLPHSSEDDCPADVRLPRAMSKRNPTPSRDDATERKEVKMRPESLQSPNAIPPRRSSSIQARTSSLAQERLATKTVLEPLAEGSWMSPGPKFQHTMNLSQHSGDSYPPGNFVERADTAIHANDSTWSQDKEKIVLGPYEYMEGNPGKDIRKQMISAFNAWLQVPKESLEIITKVIGMLHTSSLL